MHFGKRGAKNSRETFCAQCPQCGVKACSNPGGMADLLWGHTDTLRRPECPQTTRISPEGTPDAPHPLWGHHLPHLPVRSHSQQEAESPQGLEMAQNGPFVKGPHEHDTPSSYLVKIDEATLQVTSCQAACTFLKRICDELSGFQAYEERSSTHPVGKLEVTGAL